MKAKDVLKFERGLWRHITLVGVGRLGCVAADRYFVGCPFTAKRRYTIIGKLQGDVPDFRA